MSAGVRLVDPVTFAGQASTGSLHELMHANTDVRVRSRNNQVEMIAHQDEGVNDPTVFERDGIKLLAKNLPDLIHWNAKPLLVDATSGNVVRKLTL